VKKVIISSLVIAVAFVSSFANADEKCAAAKSGTGCCAAKGQIKTTTAAQGQVPEAKKTDDAQAGSASQAENTATLASPVEIKIEAEPAAVTPASGDEAKISAEMKIMEPGCPDVAGRNELNNFHENMHPMHMALEESKYADLKAGLPKLVEASKALAAYKCPMWDKCSDECKKDFETKKASLLNAVGELAASCKGDDNAKIDGTFEVMHEAYIQFASICAHAAEKTETGKVEETKQ
jgi:hypothetical protein